MILTAQMADPAYKDASGSATWVDVDHAIGLDLDLCDELLDVQKLITPGLRCDQGHPWWLCIRGMMADYLYLAGADVIHLHGEHRMDHRHYVAGDNGRWAQLEAKDPKVFRAWDVRIRRMKGLG